MWDKKGVDLCGKWGEDELGEEREELLCEENTQPDDMLLKQ